MPKVLPAKCYTYNEGSAKKDGHQHFYLVAFCCQLVPANETSEAQNDEAESA